MASIINSTSSGSGGLISTGDDSGELQIQTDGTTAITIASDQSTNFGDKIVIRPTLKDYAVAGSTVGNLGSTETFNLETANFFSATLDQACTFTFSNPAGSGNFCGFVLALTNGGAFTITWPASVDWPGGAAPTLTAAGLDILVFVTYNAGTNWNGLVAGLDVK